MDTEQCVLGAENKTRIIGLEKAIVHIEYNVEKLTNCYSRRPTWGVVVAITTLVGAVSTMALYIITH